MSPRTARLLTALFAAYVVATAIHIAYVVYHEPFAFDAWNVAIDTNAKPASVHGFFAFWHKMYTSSNPRIGQPMAYLAYKLVGFAEVATPLAFLSIVLACFVLGNARMPSRRDGRDLATLAIGIGFLWFAAPNLPAYMFCRAYATNYIYVAAIQLWFLVPIRLARDDVSPLKLVGYALLGVVAGMGNEHVGPTLCLFMFAYTLWRHRRDGRWSPLLVAGTLGVVVGFALIFFAPGQGQRYGSVAEHYSALQQIRTHGISVNLDIFLDDLKAAAPFLVLLVLAVSIGLLLEDRVTDDLEAARERQRRALAYAGGTLVAGMLITITVFASPKLGPRFYLHSMILLLSGVMGVMRSFLNRVRSFAPFVAFAVVASTFAAARTVPLYTRLKIDSDRRLAELAATPRGQSYTAEAWEQIPEEWWFLGDDCRDQKKQELIANYFDIDRVLFRGNEMWATLGVSDVKLTMHYDIEPAVCLDELDQLDLPPYIGRDVEGLQHAFLDKIARIQNFGAGALHKIDLVATFLGVQPPMPPGTIFVARWNEGQVESYAAKVRRVPKSTRREVIVPAELVKSPWDIYIIRIGDPPKLMGTSQSPSLTYEPWETGAYWVTACKPDHCFVIAALSHRV
jgi:hypothetical protein